jgi:Peptidase C13 family
MRQKMGDEDALFVFLTSHGGPGPEHEFLMELGPLALNQLTPEHLRDGLKAAGVDRYFGLISACYSGGYLDRLQNVNAIVMTAARADRTSFGCAPDADLTYFGRAYLLEALNKTKDFVKAFELAERSIEAREKSEELLASTPQIRIGRGAREWLNDWQRRMEPGEPVPFYPAAESALHAEPSAH